MKRLWGIRHIRWWWLSRRVHAWAHQNYLIGLGMGIPNPSDLQYLDHVWKGEL